MKICRQKARGKLARLYLGIVVAALCAVSALVGCGAKPQLELTAPNTVGMYVGETRDLMPYLDFSRPIKDAQASFTSSDETIVQVDGSVARAVAQGSAIVTVTTKYGSAEIGIAAEYRAANTLGIVCDGDTVQNVSELSEVTPMIFSALTDEFIDPRSHVEWYVDGKSVSADSEWEFLPTRSGAFTVTAVLQELTATEIVRVYRTTNAYGQSRGALEQTRDFSAVVFTAYEEIDSRNPQSVVEWKVNGVTESENKVFEFTPEAQGRYEIELYVNGVKRKIDKEDSVVIDARGDRAPDCAVQFDADGVYVTWKDGASARSVIITSPSGARTVYSASDVSHAHRFGDGIFDATGLIDPTAQTPGEYSVSVSGIAFGNACVFKQYGDDAREYINNRLLINNSFIDSEERADEFMLELYVLGSRSASAYLARGVDCDKVEQAVRARAKSLGIVSSVAVDGNIMTVELGEYYNAPAKNSAPLSERRMYSVLPHIEYNEDNRRASDHALAVDRIERTAVVSGTEQLLFAVLSGYKPTAAKGSIAEHVFGAARRALISIIGKDYSKEQKVHAIYDWLQWTALKTDGGDRESSCNYLESIFYGGSRASSTVTSLGAAKAFALLSSMEGIATEIVPVVDGDDYYYINTVAIDGVKYMVDVFGGEYAQSASRELCSHERLFIDDETARSIGIYDETVVLGGIDGGKMVYLEKAVSGSVYYDYYISADEKNDTAAIRAGVFGAFDNCRRGEATIFSVGGTVSVMNETFGAEFFMGLDLSQADIDDVTKHILKAVDDYAKSKYGESFRDGTVSVYKAGRSLHVTAIMPRQESMPVLM